MNPLLYAASGSLTAIAPLTARVWSGTPGAATLCAAIAGLIAAPMSALGFLLLFALVLPALAFDLVLWRSRTPSTTRLIGAAIVAGVVIWAISLPVIDPEFLSAVALVALVVIRVVSYIAVALIARAIATRLVIVGQRNRRGRPISIADAQIASITAQAQATLATRNTKDFDGINMTVVNPWEADAARP